MDATYRADLRELNEINFARFDAKLEQRLADVRAELRAGLAVLEGKLLGQIGELRGDMTGAIERAQSAMVRWMFTFWAPTAIAIVGTAIGVIVLLLRR